MEVYISHHRAFAIWLLPIKDDQRQKNLRMNHAEFPELEFCRVYCTLLRPDLARIMAKVPQPDTSFFALFAAVQAFERHARHHCPSALGAQNSELNPVEFPSSSHKLVGLVEHAWQLHV